MKKVIFGTFSLLLILVLTTSSQADTAMAKQVLAQNTTNPVCSSGYNGNNPFLKAEQFKKDQMDSGCPAGGNYVECLRNAWKNQK